VPGGIKGGRYFDKHTDVIGEQPFAHMVDSSPTWSSRVSCPAGNSAAALPATLQTSSRTRESTGTTSSLISRVVLISRRAVILAWQQCHRILEVHLVDRSHQIGGSHEELLDIGERLSSADA
jgi:Xaa-Pro dipeptidase